MHGDEIPFVFNNLEVFARPPTNNCSVTGGDKALADRISRLWGTFARNATVKAWPKFEANTEAVVKLELAMPRQAFGVETLYRTGMCALLDDLGVDDTGNTGLDLFQQINKCV